MEVPNSVYDNFGSYDDGGGSYDDDGDDGGDGGGSCDGDVGHDGIRQVGGGSAPRSTELLPSNGGAAKEWFRLRNPRFGIKRIITIVTIITIIAIVITTITITIITIIVTVDTLRPTRRPQQKHVFSRQFHCSVQVSQSWIILSGGIMMMRMRMIALNCLK